MGEQPVMCAHVLEVSLSFDNAVVNGIGELFAGKAAFLLFVYLEILDASFSFDGVICV